MCTVKLIRQAVMLLGNREAQSDAEKERIRRALLPVFLNLSLAELRLDSPHKALKYGNKALEIDSANIKALFRCGQVRLAFCLCVVFVFLIHQIKIPGVLLGARFEIFSFFTKKVPKEVK